MKYISALQIQQRISSYKNRLQFCIRISFLYEIEAPDVSFSFWGCVCLHVHVWISFLWIFVWYKHNLEHYACWITLYNFLIFFINLTIDRATFKVPGYLLLTLQWHTQWWGVCHTYSMLTSYLASDLLILKMRMNCTRSCYRLLLIAPS